jgi:hypothetical protein
MTDEEFFAMIDQEAQLLERFGLTDAAERMRACTTLGAAVDLYDEVKDALATARTLDRLSGKRP